MTHIRPISHDDPALTVDAVQRMFRRLVSTIRARYPQYLERPFEVGELHQTILPYRHHRQALGLDTNEDYEIALLELLVGPHGYMIVDDRMRDTLSPVLQSPHPDPAALREFAGSRVALSPDAVRRLDETPAPQAVSQAVSHAPPPGVSPTISHSVPAARAAAATSGSAPPTRAAGGRKDKDVEHASASTSGAPCMYCNAPLPVGRAVTFCPHCGQNVTVVVCTACGTELEMIWKYCTTCGRPTGRG